MRLTLLEKITLERGLVYILIFSVIVTFGFIFYLFFSQFTRNIEVTSPIGAEEWEIGQTYQVTWEARGIDRVGIVVFKGKEPKWIAKNVYADLGRYEWKIYPGQEFGDDYWIAVFEYPWKKDSRLDFSDGAFAIVYPELASCDMLSIESEWPYVPSDLPNLRRVFITEQGFTGDLGGLEGADKICQEEAERKNFEGVWHAFLGGDNEQDFAIERVRKTPRATDGVYIEATSAATLIRGSTCHRLLGGDFNKFLENFSDLSIINQRKLEDKFFQNFGNIWLGRLDGKSKMNCTIIETVASDPYKPLAEKYSFTTTCQNWTTGNKLVQGYPVAEGTYGTSFPSCYASGGVSTKAVILGGLASGLVDEGTNKAFTP